MSTPTIASLATNLIDGTIEVMWRQWAVIGGSAAGVSRDAHSVVDPEALVLASLSLADRERRLDDIAASWVTVNSGLLSVQRLKNLLPDFPAGTAGRLSGLAGVAIAAKDVRWTSITDESTPPVGRDNKLRATAVTFQQPSTLMLQLRRGMGVGVKADVLAYLLTSWFNVRSWASTATIVDAIGYTSAAVRRGADDLAAARFIDTPNVVRTESQSQRLYSVEPARWMPTLGFGNMQPGWRSWRERFALVAAIVDADRRYAEHPVSDYALDVALREILETHQSSFTRDSVLRPDFLRDAADWPATFTRVTDTLGGWMRNSA